jgi:Flp pilus assembly protein TadG
MTIEPRTRTVASEQGAILIQTGVLVLVICAFAMFAVDYGVLWVSRNQAQNAADAGALAGAAALALDDFDDRSDTGPAKLAARRFSLSNYIFGAAPNVNMTTDVRFYTDAPADFPASCSTDDCIRVDVYRNQVRGNPLPMFFGWLVDVYDQGVRATATAQAAAANASNCLKPWAIADKWEENNPPADTYDPTGPTPDRYERQNGTTSAGTSYTLADVGTEVTLKLGTPGDTQITPGWFQALDLPCPKGGGGACYAQNISGCSNATFSVGDSEEDEDLHLWKEPGNKSGPTTSGTTELIDKDPLADWDPDAKRVVNSCVGPPYTCSVPGYTQSPRIVTIPVFDTQKYYDTGGPGNGTIEIVQILGFFVDRLEYATPGQPSVVGYLATTAGLTRSDGGTVARPAAFLKAITLVR